MTSHFDSLDSWHSDPKNAFDSFVISTAFLELSRRKPLSINEATTSPLRISSVKVYKAMFARYLRWLATHQIKFLKVTSSDLMAFLEGKQGEDKQPILNSRIKYRYLRLMERIYTHLQVVPNPSQHACFDIFQGDRSKAGRDESMSVLTEEQQAAFLAALPTSTTNNWKTVRDRAMQTMMIGAGLKVSEVISIRVRDVGEVSATGSIPITITPGTTGGIARWHQTQLRPFAVAEVQNWLRERRDRKIPGALLFPATLNGGRLDPSTVYRQVKATFERAEVAVPRRGGRTLRNTFAVRELNGGADTEVVGEYLGHRKRRAINEYSAAAAELLKTQKTD
jgi:integrase/recombinase XerD